MEGEGLREHNSATESVGDIDLDKRGADVSVGHSIQLIRVYGMI